MADYKAICESTGVNNWRWAEVADRAKKYLASGQKPRIVDETELNDAIQFVAANSNTVCESADGIARAALVEGYVAQAESIDTTISPDKVRDQVTLDYYSFRHLVPMTTGSSLNGLVNRFANDVLDVVSPWFCDHRFNTGPTEEQEPTLQAVMNKIVEVKKQGKKPVVIFDLDDTLFDPARYREWHILQAYLDDFVAKNPGKLSDDEIAKVRAIKPEEVGFSVSLDLQAVFGVKNKELADHWYPFFKTHFFTNDCANDPVYPGAVEFVNNVFKAGAMVVYFTGRNEHEKKKAPGEEQGMRAGSEADLKKSGFPVPNGKNVFLFMKPDIDDDDMEYKGKTIPSIKEMGTVVAAFDNEPKADKFYTEQTGSIVGDLGMCQFPFYGAKKTLQDIPFEPETTVRISDFRRAGSPPAKVADLPQKANGSGGGKGGAGIMSHF